MAFSVKIPLSRRQLWEKDTGHSQFSIKSHKPIDLPDIGVTIATASAPTRSSTRYVKKSTSEDAIRSPLHITGDGYFSGTPDKLPDEGDSHLSHEIIDIPDKLIFSKLDIFLNCFSIILYIADIGFDCFLCYKHYLAIEQEPLFFVFTLVFILLASVVTSIFSLWWYYFEYVSKKKDMPDDASTRTGVLLRVIACALTLGPVVRYIDTIAYGWRSRKKGMNSKLRQYYYSEMQFQRTDGAMLRLFEAFLESAPQFLLQVYIMLSRRGLEGQREGNYFLIAVTIGSIVLSVVSLAWSVVAYHKALRMSRHDVDEIKLFGIAVRFLWRIFEISPRIVIFAMFMSVYGYFLGLFASLHYLLMIAWLFSLKTNFCEKPRCELGFIFVMGLVWCFCFFNLKDGHTRQTCLLYYTLFFAENIALSVAWFCKTHDDPDIWYRHIVFPIVLGSIVPMVVSIVCYYKLLHRKPIPNCLPWSYWKSFRGNSPSVRYTQTEGSAVEREELSEPSKSDSKTLSPSSDTALAPDIPAVDEPEELVAPDSSIPAYRAPTPCRFLEDNSANAGEDLKSLPNLDDCVEINGYLEPSILNKPSGKLVRQDTIPKYMAPVPNNYGATIPGGAPALHTLAVSVSSADPSHGSTLPGSSTLVTVVSNGKDKEMVSSTPTARPPLTAKATLEKPPVPLPRLSIHHESPAKSTKRESSSSFSNELTLTTVSDLPAGESLLFDQTLSPSPVRVPFDRDDQRLEDSGLDITPVVPRRHTRDMDKASPVSSLDTPMKVNKELGGHLDLSIDTPVRETLRSRKANVTEM
ncbi:uncharacterized protein [Watersipora subatra]|uniref:uncharacterized protein n=1 Tax=Watersipora subatra TaxID=2589382 RepID=UPI00355B59E2